MWVLSDAALPIILSTTPEISFKSFPMFNDLVSLLCDFLYVCVERKPTRPSSRRHLFRQLSNFSEKRCLVLSTRASTFSTFLGISFKSCFASPASSSSFRDWHSLYSGATLCLYSSSSSSAALSIATKRSLSRFKDSFMLLCQVVFLS